MFAVGIAQDVRRNLFHRGLSNLRPHLACSDSVLPVKAGTLAMHRTVRDPLTKSLPTPTSLALTTIICVGSQAGPQT